MKSGSAQEEVPGRVFGGSACVREVQSLDDRRNAVWRGTQFLSNGLRVVAVACQLDDSTIT